nr:unnamed protein product [Callosobruchus analis]
MQASILPLVYFEKEEVDRLFGLSIEENIDKLKGVVDTAVNTGLEMVKNAADSVDSFLSKLAAEQGPALAKVVLDLSKGLVGLKNDLDKKSVPTNICLIDKAVKKIDTLPNDVGRQVLICKKTVATHIAKYLDKTQAHFEKATEEAADVAKSALDCLDHLNLLCVGKVALQITAAIFRIPNEVTRQASDTVDLFNSFQKRGEVCLTTAIDRASKKATGYIDKVEECLKKHNIHFEPLVEQATAEGVALAKSGLDCLRQISFVCVSKMAVKIAASIFRIPKEFSKQVSDTIELISALQRRGEIKAGEPESINEEESRLLGIFLERIVLKLKEDVDKGIESVYKTLTGVIDDSNKLLNQAADIAIPTIGEKVIDFGKVLDGLRERFGGKNVNTNVCRIDEASRRIDRLPDNLGNLILSCRKHFVGRVNTYAGNVKNLLEKANNETYSIVSEGLKCAKSYQFGCITGTAAKALAAAVKIPGDIAYIASKTGSLFLVLPKQAVSCISAALEKTTRRGQKYVRLVEQCWERKFKNPV